MIKKIEAKAIDWKTQEGVEGAYLSYVITHEDFKDMGLTMYRTHKLEFDITYTYSEIFLVLAGQLKITTEGKTHVFNRGDIGFVKKGTKAHVESPDISETFCVTHPALTDELLEAAFAGEA